jgi:hypothetical protein
MCSSCAGNWDILVYLLIVLVFVVVIGNVADLDSGKTVLLALVSTAFVVYWQYTYNSTEHLESPVIVDDKMIQPDGIQNYNYDDRKYSEYGNISMARDIDSMEQRSIDLVLPDDKSNAGWDNSDLVEASIDKHSSNFQPDRAHGFSSTNSAYLSNMTLGEPNPLMPPTNYTVPLNDFAYDLDESLSRGQQYRASINKRAIDGAVRSTRNVFQKSFTNELDENEAREWWSAESTKFETDFRPYY